MDQTKIRLIPMTDDMYRCYFKEYENDPDLFLQGQPYFSYTYSEEKVDKYVQRQRDLKRITLAIMYDDEIAGEIIIKNIEEHKCATMGITLKNPKYKDRGIGTEAEKQAIRYVFYELDIPTLYADTVRTNTRSQHVLEKVGFVFIREDKDFKYYRIDRQMIILITGASHTGKTLLAQKLLEKYHYPYLSVDHLKMGLIRSGKTELTPEDDEALTDYLWPVVREMIKTAIENHQNLIVEGCYVPFDWRQDFDENYLPFIRFICLAFTEEYIENHFDEILEHESEIERRLFDADLTVAGLKEDNKCFIDGFQKAGERVTIISSDYEQSLTELVDS